MVYNSLLFCMGFPPSPIFFHLSKRSELRCQLCFFRKKVELLDCHCDSVKLCVNLIAKPVLIFGPWKPVNPFRWDLAWHKLWAPPIPSLFLFFMFYFYFFSICVCVCVYFFISWRLITLQYCSGFCHTLK